jgi:transketolase
MSTLEQNKASLGVVAANNIRILAASMVEKAKSGHPGGAMGGADFIHVLFSEFLRFDPKNTNWFHRDRFFLDPGHMSPMLYAQLSLIEKFNMEELSNFRQWGSPTPGHPEKDFARGIENTSGPLGQGHVMAIGAAIAAKFLAAKFGNWMDHTIYAFISDGGVQEEISQGGGRIAGHLGLGNLVMFYDSNDIQLSTTVAEVTSENVAMKYKAWGWEVIEIVGNDQDQIRQALKQANSQQERPTIIIGKTVMGKGALDANGNCFEGKTSTHGMPLSEAGASYAKTIENLGGDAANPFVIFPEVAEFYAQVLEKKHAEALDLQKVEEKWAAENSALATKLADFVARKLPNIDWAGIEQKEDQASRAASSTVLAHLAETVENMIVASADLANSDKTDGFLKKTKAMTRNDFSGQFLQAGVAELTMAAIANGMAIHGGVLPAIGTFFVFSDYMKPALRLSALMELPVVYIWTHDAFRVGEDASTY